MNAVTLGYKLVAEAEKDYKLDRDMNGDGAQPFEFWLGRATQRAIKAYKVGQAAVDMMLESRPTKKGTSYAVTIRPRPATEFDMFYHVIQKLLQRKCFVEWTASFEQKGTSEEALGEGFHVHIVATMTQKSKGEVARDVLSTVGAFCEEQGVHVVLAKTPDAYIQNYLIDYNVDDGHKESTKSWDALWREKEGLLPLYKNEMGPRISSSA